MRKAVITIHVETNNPESVDSPTILDAVYNALKARNPQETFLLRLPLAEIKWNEIPQPEPISIRLKDYLVPNGKYPYDSLASLLEQYHKDGKKWILVSVPGFCMGTNYPGEDMDHPFSDMAGEFYKSVKDLLSNKNGKRLDD